MSYILDALTRSEQERNRGSVPDLHTVQAPFAQSEDPRVASTGYLAIASLLACAGAVAAWLHAHGAISEKPSVRTESVALQRVQILPVPPETSYPAPSNESAGEETQPPTPVATKPKKEKPPVLPLAARVPAAPPQPAATRSRDERASLPSELPAALQKELAQLAIYGFADSPETGRMAIINGRVVVEGDEFGGLTVERIAPGNLTLRYKDHRFRQSY